MKMDDYQTAGSYWLNRDKEAVKMPEAELKEFAETFIKSHDTCAFATTNGSEVRNTPIEYTYLDGRLYLLSEGGIKFFNLAVNKQVGVAIFESYDGFHNLSSIQINGKADILAVDSNAYRKVLELKHIPLKTISKLEHPLYLIEIVPQSMELLFSKFKQHGYSVRQHLEMVV